jgi:hypothetical protein
MGVVRPNYRIYLDYTIPSLTLPLQGGGNFAHLHKPCFMRSTCLGQIERVNRIGERL